MRNPNWTREELILALDLYFKVAPLKTSETNPEIVALSNVLNQLSIHADRPDATRFRNPNGVYMKMCNFLRLDPSYKGTGLKAGSKADRWSSLSRRRRPSSCWRWFIHPATAISTRIQGSRHLVSSLSPALLPHGCRLPGAKACRSSVAFRRLSALMQSSPHPAPSGQSSELTLSTLSLAAAFLTGPPPWSSGFPVWERLCWAHRFCGKDRCGKKRGVCSFRSMSTRRKSSVMLRLWGRTST
jgi:hypothetical protein